LVVSVGCVGVFRLRGCFASRSSHFAQDDSVLDGEKVKAGHVQSAYVRDLRGVIEREDAQVGVLI